MANEEVKILVSAPGAAQAAAEIRGVAGAEQAVAAPVAGATAVQGQQAETLDLLAGRHQTLIGALRQLGPEAAMAADMLQGLSNRATGNIEAMGFLSAGVLALCQAYSALQYSQDRAKERSEKAIDYLDGERASYLALAAAIEQARQAEEQRRGGAAVTGGGDALAAHVLAMAPATGLGSEEIQAVGAALGAASARGDVISESDSNDFAIWYGLGRGGKETDGFTLWRMFKAEQSRNPDLSGKLQQALQRAESASPAVYQLRRTQAASEQVSTTPGGRSAAALAEVAAFESAAGGTTKSGQDVLNYLGGLAANLQSPDAEERAAASNALNRFFQARPQAEDIRVRPMREGYGFHNLQRRDVFLPDPDGPRLADYLYNLRPHARADMGLPFSGQPGDIHIYGNVQQGGTMINQDGRVSPAGRPVGGQAPR